MRNSAWSLLVLTASIVTLASIALALPTLHGGSGKRESAWELLLEWRRNGAEADMGSSHASPPPMREHETAEPRISLRLLDQDGEPVVQARITADLYTANSIGQLVDSHSLEDGSFLSRPLPPGQYQVQVEADGFLEVEPVTLQIPRDRGETLILLQAGCVVEGYLNGTDGVPRNHGVLALRPADVKEEEAILFLEPETDGSFRFPPVTQGEWKLAWMPHRKQAAGPNLTTTLQLQPGTPFRFEITLVAPDPRVPTDPATKGVGIHPISD